MLCNVYIQKSTVELYETLLGNLQAAWIWSHNAHTCPWRLSSTSLVYQTMLWGNLRGEVAKAVGYKWKRLSVMIIMHFWISAIVVQDWKNSGKASKDGNPGNEIRDSSGNQARDHRHILESFPNIRNHSQILEWRNCPAGEGSFSVSSSCTLIQSCACIHHFNECTVVLHFSNLQEIPALELLYAWKY